MGDSKAALARSRMYKIIASAFAYPQDEFHSYVNSNQFKEDLNAVPLVLSRVYKAAEELNAATVDFQNVAREVSLENLREEYQDVFGHTISKACPPYETQYGCTPIQQIMEMSKIAGFYRAFGLEAKSAAGERLDHISTELEYMQFLCYKEAYAIKHNHGAAKVTICLDAQKKFLSEHLGKWAFLFTTLLKKKAGGGYYNALAALLENFISCELTFLSVEPEKLERLELTPVPCLEESTCFSCGKGEEDKDIPH